MMDLTLSTPTAATLELKGSVGHFWIGARDENSAASPTLDVTYFLTYVGLDIATGTNDQLLSHLTPVRETFVTTDLEFDELMQRDIDDSRISEELIPYLLDTRTRQLVRLFPPIVVLLLPVSSDGRRPADLYPSVERFSEEVPGAGHDLQVVQSGPTGSETFRIEVPKSGENIHYHDLNRLRINPARCRLVIVDGQHRAMALLALHRNLTNAWSDERRAPYRDFYAHWTPGVLEPYDLRSVSLPLMICAIPELDMHYSGDIDLKQAGRSIFLALNKNARKVSMSRNRLLDDSDIVAECLRAVLTEIKHAASVCLEPDGLIPLWSIELDQVQDRTRLATESAVTGVNHLYYIIEHLLMRDRYTHGITTRPGYYGQRTRIDEGLARLGASEVLTSDVVSVVRRDNYSNAAGELLSKRFLARYGREVASLLSDFPPLRAHLCAYCALEPDVRREEAPAVYQLLYGGQGVSNVLGSHIANLSRRHREDDPVAMSEEAESVLRRLRELQQRREIFVQRARERAVSELLPDGVPSGDEAQGLRDEVWRLIELSRTVAFQAAVICTPLEVADYCVRLAQQDDADTEVEAVVFEVARDFKNSVFPFFEAHGRDALSRLMRALRGSGLVEGSWVLEPPSSAAYRDVVLGGGELQPDAWPRFRLMLLELWEPEYGPAKDRVKGELQVCRRDTMRYLYRRLVRAEARRRAVSEESLDAEVRQRLFEDSFDRLGALTSCLSGASLSRSEMEAAVGDVSAGEADVDVDD